MVLLCPECGMYFTNNDIQDHICDSERRDTQFKIYKCQLCGIVYITPFEHTCAIDKQNKKRERQREGGGTGAPC